MSRKPKRPKFPKKPKSNNIEALERWVKRCSEIKADYDKSYTAWKRDDDRKKSLISKGMKAKELRR